MGLNKGRGGVSFVSQGDGSVVGSVRHDDDYRGKYFNLIFPTGAPVCNDGDGFSDPTGVAGDENLCHFPQVSLAYHIIGTQTILAPTMSYSAGAPFFLPTLDLADGDGVEYVFGAGLGVGNPLAHVVGSSPASFLKIRDQHGGVANVGECAIGFRIAAAFDALIDDYTDMAVLNMQAGNIFVETILNNAATDSEDTGENMADDVSRTREVRVTSDGQVTYFVDGVKFGPAFQFDDGDVIIPFYHFLQAGGTSGGGWETAEGGALWHLRKDPRVQAVNAPAV